MPKEKTIPTVTMMVGTNDISGGKYRKITRLSDNFKRLIGDVHVKFDPDALTICTVPFNMLLDQNSIKVIKRVIFL